MKIIESIKKARERGFNDKEILEKIEKQNPEKKEFFNKARERGLNPSEILDEIMNQNISSFNEENEVIKEKEPLQLNVNIPQRPSEESKLWIRIFISLGLAVLTALFSTLFYRSFFIPRIEPVEPERIVREVHTPQATSPLLMLYPEKDEVERFAISSEEEFLIHMKRIIEEERDGDIVRVIVEDHREDDPSIFDLKDLEEIFGLNFPQKFFEKIDSNFNLIVHPNKGRNDLAFIARFDEEDEEEIEWTIMRPWEETIEKDLQGLFSFLEKEIPLLDSDLEPTPYEGDAPRTVSIRHRKGEDGVGLYYAIMRERLLFATSLETMEKLIERYYEYQREN